MDIEDFLEIPPWDWPREAGTIFRDVLMDSRASESDRLIAAQLAGDMTVINDDLALLLLEIASNAGESEQIRAKAVISFGPALEDSDSVGFEDPDVDDPISPQTFQTIQGSLRKLYFDDSIPREVRRRVLEASVRAQQSWHQNAIRDAYSGGDRDWMLTAVFAMRWVSGFDDQILEALKNPDPEIHYAAVIAAGDWELDAAWPHIVALVTNVVTPKRLLIAAIGALGSIRLREAVEILGVQPPSRDEDIAEAVSEVFGMASHSSDDPDDEEDPDERIH